MGNSQADFQARLFSIFLTLTIAPPLIQQLQPKYLELRSIYKSREASSKIYSWFAFTIGAVVVELPYCIIAGTIYYCCWWWGAPGRGVTSFGSFYAWLMLMLFELFYVGFGQAIASVSPNELLASIMVPLFFLFVVSFCGVVVPYAVLPYFWQSWMYYVTPFHYLLEGLLSVAVHGQKIVCAANELARFHAPPGQTCQSYTEAFIDSFGGYVQNGTNGICEFCPHATGDEYVSTSHLFSFLWGT